MGHFLLTTVGTGGDVTPFVLLGQALQDRGHRATVLTHCVYETECKQAGLGFAALDTPAEFDGFIRDGHWLNTGPGISRFLQQYVIPSISAHYEAIRANCTPETVIVGRSTPNIAARLVAEKLQLPFISVLMAPHHITAFATVAALVDALFSTQINTMRSRLGLPDVHDWCAWWQAANLSVGLWPAWFSPLPVQMQTQTVLAGFLWQSKGAIEDSQTTNLGDTPPILITGGTGMFGGKEFFKVCAEACGCLGRPTILVARISELLPAKLPENVRWVEYVPRLDRLMPQMELIIHHGGMGTLSGALAAGIPQVILAAGGDRPENALYTERLGVAEFLPRPRWETGLVAQSVERMIASDVVRQRCRAVAGWLRQADVTCTACDALETVMASGKPYLAMGLADGTLEKDFSVQENSVPQPPACKSARTANLTPEERALLAARLRQKKQT